MPATLFDPVILGRHVKAARILAGFDRVQDATQRIEDVVGISLSERTFSAIERGEQVPSLEQFLAIAHVLRPPGGGAFWFPMLRADIAAGWIEELDAGEVVRQGGKPRASTEQG